MSVKLSSAPRGSEGLAERRRLRRRRSFIAVVILLAILCAGIVYELRQSAFRISQVQIFGADQSFSAFATDEMQGYYLGVIPRDSTLFFPESRIRADIIAAHPDIAAVSIFRDGLTGLSIKVNDRTPVARWCGLAPTTGVDEYCYVFDVSGYIFAAAATSSQMMNRFALYAPLTGDTLEPLRATIARAEKLPATFDFARQLGTLGSQVTQVIIRGDEVDDMLTSGTRVTYVLGNEQNAFTALVSAQSNLNVADGSLEYVDLRFDGKVYLKKKGLDQ